ncbi:uncharacterized protein CLUP02_01385 [Colletotrichum lupini]|uniref:Uncharacterized protein n=1 Tax=Colletotrichum lupini TaxID=145971 RepID=A0A9Q8SCV0_9PEZI|nr:uncharacterized protein CLUP02_01385 [Colletotrichum lupini]UQC74733.1 hypothetical protein CLUP02_01385 [Colletotrichum lupini]
MPGAAKQHRNCTGHGSRACWPSQRTPRMVSSADRCTFPARLFDVHSDQVTDCCMVDRTTVPCSWNPIAPESLSYLPLRFDLQKSSSLVTNARLRGLGEDEPPFASSALTPYFGRGMSLSGQSVSFASCRFYVQEREFLQTLGITLPDIFQRVDIQGQGCALEYPRLCSIVDKSAVAIQNDMAGQSCLLLHVDTMACPRFALLRTPAGRDREPLYLLVKRRIANEVSPGSKDISKESKFRLPLNAILSTSISPWPRLCKTTLTLIMSIQAPSYLDSASAPLVPARLAAIGYEVGSLPPTTHSRATGTCDNSVIHVGTAYTECTRSRGEKAPAERIRPDWGHCGQFEFGSVKLCTPWGAAHILGAETVGISIHSDLTAPWPGRSINSNLGGFIVETKLRLKTISLPSGKTDPGSSYLINAPEALVQDPFHTPAQLVSYAVDAILV